ncbi:CRISPR-associated endonuclease Cas1 [Vibrio sp. MarTm2]|uniref:CRISPR-associated endonuclease Cas1 n=1 Tax=Vibrio sp. MarTm2 TaxID=2998831 RepID=UPI0022CD7C74|nr:CRISPR-associated endonuclease Cas1 [Vibrio sp. MarTm2]MDA0129464.1 CRISPR-associated endonuclease Cas1 [Vibrio sp. MarTm2]
MALELSLDDLQTGWKKVASNKGMPGSDGVSIQRYQESLDRHLLELAQEWNSNTYQPSPYRKVTIQKANNKQRELAIPSVKDRIIHTAITQKLLNTFEPEFEHISYGYRPNRSYTHAIRHIEQLRDQGYSTVIDADIQGYFDHICHDTLTELLARYLPEDWVQAITHTLLSHQAVDGELCFGVDHGFGIPQGSPLSPILANLYLDGFDEALLDRGEQIIRYADDFVVLLPSEERAQSCLAFITDFLDQLKLTLNCEKTRVVSFQDGFTFLGVTFLDNMVLPLKAHTEKALVNIGKYELELNEDDIDSLDNEEDQSLNHTLWHSALPPALRSLQSAIFDDDSALPIEPDSSRIERLSLNHVARLKLVYIHKQGAAIHKRGNRLNVFSQGKAIQSIPANCIDMILCFGAIHLTTSVQRFCLENDISVVWLTQSGQYLGCLSAPFQGDPMLAQAQVTSRMQLDTRLALVRFFLRSKINNNLGVMRRHTHKRQRDKPAEKRIVQLRDQLESQKSVASMRGTEGAAAREFFQWYRKQFDDVWGFTSRNRQPPKDPINAMLSYGYTLLFHNVRALVEARGLLPHLGYLHGSQPRQPALVLDIMEGYRPWVVDELVLQLANKQLITPEQFQVSSKGAWLNKDGRRVFIQLLEQRLLKQHQHPTLKIKADIRRLIDLQVLELRQQLLTGQWTLTQQRIR